MNTPRFERREFDRQLIIKSLRDPTFRHKLLVNPKITYLEELQKVRPGQMIPEEVEIRTVEEKGDLFYIVLPALPDHPITEEALAEIVDHKTTHRNPCWGLGDPPSE
ncbi:hypothetical protein Mal35_16760 [Gimesia maris]|uniref:NHLP leader peptide family RiPP precursor n=1 Tax=Gimesia maris TaxID=122 RepID=UPI00118B339F|nr:NHLP leader peptide family RiPP precursor [Gimesia maris]QDT78244.1 hypothetical protein Mal35_16760 [Gimesia maris]